MTRMRLLRDLKEMLHGRCEIIVRPCGDVNDRCEINMRPHEVVKWQV